MKSIRRKIIVIMLTIVTIVIMAGCSMQKNTALNRFRQSFTTRYNIYYNGSQAFIDGSQEKEQGNKDNYTEIIPLYPVGNKESHQLGAGNFERAIEKSEKAIKLHSMKQRPEWKKNRRKTAKDIEWLSRREYNPFLWRAWLLMGKSQFQMGNFDEAAATFSYMSRLYATQPAIYGIARAWQAKSYVELGWLYDAEDIITKMRRDTMHYKAQTDWDYTLADYYVRNRQYEEAIPYLRKVIKHEKRRKQKARQWYLMGQLYTELNKKKEAYKAFQRVIRLNPPYELELNARIAQTEVMGATDGKKMVRKLKRMAQSDNNAQYLDQIYYAIGNIQLTMGDTLAAITAYERGNKESTRSGIEKGVLLLKLGNIYWAKEKYNDAKRCYGEAIGMLDKERPDYEELSYRSQVLDELVPHTDAIHLQDSLQMLAAMPEDERNAAIDRTIEALKKKEEEERRAAEDAELEKIAQQQNQQGNRPQRKPTTTATANNQGLWYFYNPTAVSQGKTQFQQQWGKRENVDDWQRANRTVVNLADNTDGDEDSDALENDSLALDGQGNDALTNADGTPIEGGNDANAEGGAGDNGDKKKKGKDGKDEDDPSLDPHNREYYLAEIPFSEEQKAESDNIIKEALFQSGVIFKDKLDNLPLGEKALTRLIDQYADYEKNDETLYHLWLLYSRMGRHDIAATYLTQLQTNYPESDWTILLSDPYFAENAKFGVHIEDSIYAATYEAFKADRHQEIRANAKISRERFPLGANRAKFVFIEGLSMLNDGDTKGCIESMTEVIEKHPKSEISPMAGMILKGVQAGRTLHGGQFDLSGVWERRSIDLSADSAAITDTLTIERNTGYTFLLAYVRDSVNENQLLYEMAKYNFSNFMVRNFDMTIDEDNGIRRMLFTGFSSYDEVLQYARQLGSNVDMTRKLEGCRRIIISNDNLKLLGIKYSYNDYETFFQEKLAPLPISDEELLTIPEGLRTDPEDQPTDEEDYSDQSGEDFGEGDEDFGEGGKQETDDLDIFGEGGELFNEGNAATEENTSDDVDFFDVPQTESTESGTGNDVDFFDVPATNANQETPTEQEDFFDIDAPATNNNQQDAPTESNEPDIFDVNEPAIESNEPEIEVIDFDEDFYR